MHTSKYAYFKTLPSAGILKPAFWNWSNLEEVQFTIRRPKQLLLPQIGLGLGF